MADISAYEPLFGKYTSESLIANTASGSVYRASCYENGRKRTVAVKLISVPGNELETASAADPAFINRMRERLTGGQELMKRFAGNNNVCVPDEYAVIDTASGFDMLIRMEYMMSLAAIMDKRHLSEDEIVKIAAEMTSALDAFHKQGLTHRDVRPSNILIGASGTYKLAPISDARQLGRLPVDMSDPEVYACMSPELYKGQGVTPTSDIYALGIVLYKLLNGNLIPFADSASSDATVTALMRRIGGEPLPMPREADPALASIVLRACAFDPADRYQSASVMMEDLMQYASGTAAPAAAAPSAPDNVPVQAVPDTMAAPDTYVPIANDGYAATGYAPTNYAPAGQGQTFAPAFEPDTAPRPDTVIGPDKPKRNKKALPFIIGGAALLVLILGVMAFLLLWTDSIAADPGKLDVVIGDTAGMTVSIDTILVKDAQFKHPSYESSKPDIATVDSNGVITGVAEGKATITISSGTESDTCVVNVLWPTVDIGGQTVRTDVTELDIALSDVTDIASLADFTSLTSLNLSGNSDITDISALSGLTTLENLDLSSTGVTDISPVSGLTGLKSLSLAGLAVSDISPLSGLTALETVDLSHTDVTDFTPLAPLAALTDISISEVKNGSDFTGVVDRITVPAFNASISAAETMELQMTDYFTPDVFDFDVTLGDVSVTWTVENGNAGAMEGDKFVTETHMSDIYTDFSESTRIIGSVEGSDIELVYNVTVSHEGGYGSKWSDEFRKEMANGKNTDAYAKLMTPAIDDCWGIDVYYKYTTVYGKPLAVTYDIWIYAGGEWIMVETLNIDNDVASNVTVMFDKACNVERMCIVPSKSPSGDWNVSFNFYITGAWFAPAA